MKIRYILGGAGSGKLSKCVEEILEREQKNGDVSSILIVPEQFTLQAESKLINSKQEKILFTTQVLSFKRLAYRVFSEIGLNNKVPLEDIGKIMIFRKIINKLSKEGKLAYFSEKAYSNIGILEKINETIQEFLECNINLEELDNVINSIDTKKHELTVLKLNDMKLIYSEFKKFIEKEYISNEEILTILSDKLSGSNFICKDTVVWIYGFNGFSIQELNVISALANKVKQINICFTYISENIHITTINPFDAFYNVKNTMKKIYENIILKQNIKLEEPLFLKENIRHKNNLEMKYLQDGYFLYNAKKFDKEPKNIKIFSAKNKYLEIESVAQKISYLIKEKGYRYKDIAIILAEQEYKEIIGLILNKYNLPYFLDYKKDINHHPLVELILSMFDIFIYNWRYEDIFRFLKTGFFREKLSKGQINILENYVLEYGIKGHKWKTKFKYGFYEKSAYDEEELNGIRKIILDIFKDINFAKNKKYTVLEISKKIFDLFINLKVDKVLEKWEEGEEEVFSKEITGNSSMLDIHMQVWNGISQVMEKFVQILGEEEVYIEEYAKILKAGFEKEKIGILPPTQDQILIGDFERTRLSDIKILFCLGMNEGIIPKYSENTNFISDTEKIILFSKGVELKPDSNIKLVTDDLQVYYIICKPKEQIYFYFSTSNLNGNAKKPSSIINKIFGIFPKINIEHIEKIKFDLENIYAPDAIFENLFNFYMEIEENSEEYLIFQDIFNWFLTNEEYGMNLEKIKKGLGKVKGNREDNIDKALIEELYLDKKLIASVSKLEEFRKCPFSYFLKYNMQANHRAIQKFTYLELGNMYHYILERFSKTILNSEKNLGELGKEDVLRTIDAAINGIKNTEQMKNVFEANKKYNYYLTRIRKIMLMSAYALLEQMKTGNFKAESFELGFGDLSKTENEIDYVEMDLENSFKMFLNGKIDRIDNFIKDNKEYLKIIDYKSSKRELTFEEIYNGLKLQLLMYLNILIKAKKGSDIEPLPAGAFYFEIKEELTNDFSKDKSIYDEYKLKGVLSNEKEVTENFGNTFGTTEVGKEHFDALLKLVDVLVKEIGQDIVTGNIKVLPYKYKKELGCQYCDYSSICNIDILDDKNKYNILSQKSNDKIWEKISDKIGEKIEEPKKIKKGKKLDN